TAGVALSHTVAASAPNAVTWTLSGAPAGMTLSSAGVLAWAKPVVGTYAVTVTARDGSTGLTGSAVITVKIGAATVAPAGLVITAPPMTGTVGKPLTGSIVVSAPGARGLSIGISGVPNGMGFTASGTTINAIWASPRAGSYTLVINVRDSLGRSAQAMVPVTVR
ncbi:MAG: putative Ig domain-containing protein, partial [Burkholderiaceae bacterium]